MRTFTKFFFIPVFAFFVGLAGYLFLLQFGLLPDVLDFEFMFYWSTISYVFIAMPLYFAIVHFIDKKYDEEQLLLYPLACTLLFFIPTIIVWTIIGETNTISSKALHLHTFFFLTGLIFGASMSFLKKHNK